MSEIKDTIELDIFREDEEGEDFFESLFFDWSFLEFDDDHTDDCTEYRTEYKSEVWTRSAATFGQLAEILLEAESVLIYPHINMDGDAAGSAAALCRALRIKGKEAYILIEDQMPDYLKFMDKCYFTDDEDVIKNPGISVCVDCGDTERFPMRRSKFYEGGLTVCIDHHQSTYGFCNYNHVDPEAASTGELVFQVIKEMGIDRDVEIGEAIFAAITTDTGNFQYSNTNRNCHLIMAELHDWGVDTNRISVELYENVRPEKLRITAKALASLEIIGGGKGAIAYITRGQMEETGASYDETDEIINELRKIKSVEYMAVLKEKYYGQTWVSLRAKRNGNVARIASRHYGGGHARAAGCKIYMSLEDAIDVIRRELEEAISWL
ncbi:MAG: DHH family phosphoesterase [Firmicutes bacterium]|nr:DHH family phosphoesterase [Bacillota bacterium]